MIIPSSPFPQSDRDNFDAGPLSWVMGEIREALNRSKMALYEAVTQESEAQSTTLRHAKSYLHQAHGALQIVDVDGVAILTETIEDLLGRVESGTLVLTREVVQSIDQGYQALTEYLGELLSGMPHQPIRLFPYYRALLEVRGAERIHPADLFFPDLAIKPQFPAADSTKIVEMTDYVSLRQRFERALLPFLKKMDSNTELANAVVMRDIIGEIESTQGNPQSRIFWGVMYSFAEEVSLGQIQKEIYVKQLFARINLQIRRLSQGSFSIAERLLRDALFFIAQVKAPSPRSQLIRSAYHLEGTIPVGYEEMRYGQIEMAALNAAKEHLSNAKNIWNRIVEGDGAAAGSFEQEMTDLAVAGAKLNSLPLAKLLVELRDIVKPAVQKQTNENFGLEMATALLFVENALNNIGHLSDNFAELAHAMGARLLSIVSGEMPAAAGQWLDDMSREAQQRETMRVLAGEMQASLRQVEKMLDEYFREPAQHTSLTQLDMILHQIEGALAILDQEDAMCAVQHTRTAVQCFVDAAPDTVPDQEQCRQVAQNVGALSFFIEMLQLNPDEARKRFFFDRDRGVFQAKLIEKNANQQTLPKESDSSMPIDDQYAPATKTEGMITATLPTVEDELELHQRQSAEIALSLTAEPDNSVLQEQLRESLEQIRLDATILNDTEANDRAKAGMTILDRPDFSASPEALAEILTVTSPSPELDNSLPEIVTPATDDAVDAELLEIFLSEAEEVLTCVRKTVPESRHQPHNQEHLTTLRRSFHTLKGSGRMVGLMSFGEAAWSIEQVLNLRLSESRGGDADLYALLEKAAEILEAWVSDLQLNGCSERTAAALVEAATRVKMGAPFHFGDDQSVSVAPMLVSQEIIISVPLSGDDDVISNAPFQHLVAEAIELQPRLEETSGEKEDASLAFIPSGSEYDNTIVPEILADMATAGASVDTEIPENWLAVNGVSSPDVPVNSQEDAQFIFTSEDKQMPTVEMEEQQADMQQSVANAEILFPEGAVSDIAPNDNAKRIGHLEIGLPLYTIYLAETDELVRQLSSDIVNWRHEPERHVSIQSIHAAHSLAGSSATVGFTALQEVAHAIEMVLQFLGRTPVSLTTYEYDILEHSVERLKLMLQKFALCEMPNREPEYMRLLASVRHDLEMRSISQSDSVSAPSVPQDAALEIEPKEVLDPVSLESLALLVGGELESAISPASPVPFVPVIAEPVAPFAAPVFAKEDMAQTESIIVLKDELDSDLLPVFLEEGRDMFPQMGEVLRSWRAQPENTAQPQSLLRLLHTLKGSARMAGAMALGQHLHDMETRIENSMRLGSPSQSTVDDILIRYDQGVYLFEGLQHRDTDVTQETPSQDNSLSLLDTGSTDGKQVVSGPVVLSSLMPLVSPGSNHPAIKMPPRVPASPGTAAPLIRVRADILDRLVNQAGEVSISRSKLETEVGALRQSLSELTENVMRLRHQLREIEMQAETQITSRMAHSADREFDPLEFDRFTRLQELTRMMAESVNDVGSVQQNLSRTLESATGDLSNQARLTRDLQQDLMRVRMVPFASISERLYRVTRQASKEVDKRVNLDIHGSGVEIDRSVLEKMTGPFEHLLRNAIVHGIESREARRAGGKSEIGELLIEIRQEGNEVVIQFSDDGQGLNLTNIRNKARQVGLLTDERMMSDEEVRDLIFHPGFSTAAEITELAGRGVGMDVVRSEAAALGGRVTTMSELGKGAQFTIHLPLTLAVTQVVLLSSGGKTYAVPSALVEQVQQLKTGPLTQAYNEGAVIWQGQRVSLHYLPALLGDNLVSPMGQQYSPLMILKSGHDRVAIHVDEILGNREVVVKNIGPQLARLIGIAGATVLGSGEIVLILNPVPLAQRLTHENARAPRMVLQDVSELMGAVAEMNGIQPVGPNVTTTVQGLRTQNIVMVVDDSLTVRRVTQRLLVREGYQVILAKDGVDALEHLQSVTPDVMLVDIEMPRMDGFDLTRNVRDDERTRHIPIIMITSRTAEKHRNYAMELGVNEYLGKPYQEEELLKIIAAFVAKDVSIE